MKNNDIVKKETNYTVKDFNTEFELDKIDNQDVIIIYLYSAKNLTIRNVAKIIGKSKQFVVDKIKYHHLIIENVKMQCRLKVLKEHGVTQNDIFNSRVNLLSAAIKELDTRSKNHERFSTLSINKLMELVSELSELVETKVIHETSLKESAIFPNIEFEKIITISEEG